MIHAKWLTIFSLGFLVGVLVTSGLVLLVIADHFGRTRRHKQPPAWLADPDKTREIRYGGEGQARSGP